MYVSMYMYNYVYACICVDNKFSMGWMDPRGFGQKFVRFDHR